MAAVNSLLLLVLLVAAVHSATLALGQTVKVWSLCSPANYTPGDAYDANLRGMLKDLVTVTASYGGNGNSTVGGDNGPADHQSSYGLAICYADAPPEVCRLCLAMAAGNVTLACPRAVAADMMYNNCLLRYANASFPASPDMAQRFSFYNNLTRAGEAAISAAALGMLMDRLAPAAAASLRSFAFGRTNMSAEQSLYGFVQCSAWRTCRRTTAAAASGESPRRCRCTLACAMQSSGGGMSMTPAHFVCRWTRGGRAYSLTCYTRFEVMPFYTPPSAKTIVVEPAPPPEPSPAGTTAAAKSRGELG